MKWAKAMFDLEAIDRMYEFGKRHRNPVQWRIFDKRVLLPLAQLPAAVMNETAEAISTEALRAKAVAGWFPLLAGAGLDGTEEGAPLYVPSRIGLLLELERGGYGADELRGIAELEEWAIDNMYTVDEFAYVDDDLEALILHVEAHLDAMEHGWADDPDLQARRQQEAEKSRNDLALLKGFRTTGVPEVLRPVLDKAVFRARAFDDMLRVTLLDIDRAKVKAGYSPYVMCRGHRWDAEAGFKSDGILWDHTIQGAIAHVEAGEAPAIRVPGFLLRGELVTPTRTLRPADYSVLWKQHDLDKYLEVWSQLRGERRCLNCFATLPVGNERKRFCGDKCRNAARQRRFRERNPEAVERAQKRYWESIKLEGT